MVSQLSVTLTPPSCRGTASSNDLTFRRPPFIAPKVAACRIGVCLGTVALMHGRGYIALAFGRHRGGVGSGGLTPHIPSVL